MLSKLIYFIILCNLYLSKLTINALVCTNKTIFVYGAVEGASKPMYDLVAPRYTRFRKSAGIDVTIRYADDCTNCINRGLVGPVSLPPVVFTTTTFTIPENENNIEFPFFTRAIVLIYNLPGVIDLNMTLQSISGIYRGTIKYWNDAAITRYNPNVVLPNTLIMPVARMDTDASTASITKIFKANDPSWNNSMSVFDSPNFEGDKCCNSTNWPLKDKMIYGKETVGIVGIVNSFENTIGYVTKEAIAMFDVSDVSLIKHTDHGDSAIEPSRENIERAMYSFMEDTGPNGFQLTSDYQYKDPEVYELSAFSSMVLNYSYTDKSIDCCVIQELVGFIDWFYDDITDDYMDSLGFIPLVTQLTDRLHTFVLKKISCNGELMYPQYMATFNQHTNAASLLSTGEILLYASVSVLAALIALFIAVFYTTRKRHQNDNSKWLIDSRKIKVIEHNIRSAEDKTNNNTNNNNNRNSTSISDHMSAEVTIGEAASVSTVALKNDKILKYITKTAEMDDLRVSLNLLNCKHPQLWSLETKKTMNKFKNVLARNVATFLGATVIDQAPLSVYEYCAKGTLHYVLKSTRYELTDHMKYHFALDIAVGLKYLHHNGIVHGLLSSLTCYVDSSWTVKIICWEQLTIYQTENIYQLNDDLSYTTEKLVDRASFIRMIYIDPDILTDRTQQVDVFSFGFILIEIFLKQVPYSRDVEEYQESYPDILHKKFNRRHIVQPIFHGLPTEIINFFIACVNSKEKRPTMINLVEDLKKQSNNATVGIVDMVLETLEKHAEALEEKVEERTAALKKVTQDMKNLLNEVLPPQIAEQLLAGRTVIPEQYECVTIYFSDIVGFTDISAVSSPIEVMKLLNDLWTVFDKIIEKFDVYKVDTIGDAYMVCSGLPQRNGINHCKEIALLSLALRDKCSRFKINHLPARALSVRIGMNSGPVTAGVVGSKMPQYCVFGDAVNTAARMESTSIPQKIQLTETSYNFLNNHFSNMFEMEYRGETEVKGKGTMKTYWLLEKRGQLPGQV